jgi:hypothetical protein
LIFSIVTVTIFPIFFPFEYEFQILGRSKSATNFEGKANDLRRTLGSNRGFGCLDSRLMHVHGSMSRMRVHGRDEHNSHA